MLTRPVIILLFSALAITNAVTAYAATTQDIDVAKYLRMAGQGKGDQAVNELQALDDKKLGSDRVSVKYVTLGQISTLQKKFQPARNFFESALKTGPLLTAVIHKLMTETYMGEQKYDEALKELQKTLEAHPNEQLGIQTRFRMSEIEIQLGKLQRAEQDLQFLERRSRHSAQYPEILAKLLSVEVKQNRKFYACKWARKLYSKFPAHQKIGDWGVDLVSAKIDGETVGCVPSHQDIETRMRRLMLSGQEQKARKEIDSLRTDKSEKSDADLLMVGYYEMQGFPYEALQLLITHYEERKRDPNFQQQLGRIAAQAGEYQAAIGAYASAYQLSPGSKSGRKAAFNAAFLSYQIQDYDGAYRRFTELIKKSPASGLSSDARWHLAWIEYLKGHYSVAETAFRKMYQERVVVRQRRRKRRGGGGAIERFPFRNERTQYWLAMSLFRQEKNDEARVLLSALAQSSDLSFYALVAKSRLGQLPPAPAVVTPAVAALKKTTEITAPEEHIEIDADEVKEVTEDGPILIGANGERETVEENAEADDVAGTATVTAEAKADAAPTTTKADSEQNESENDVATKRDDTNDETDSAESSDTADNNQPQLKSGDSKDEPDAATTPEETIQVTTFKDPKLRERFTRANQYAEMGYTDIAKSELFEIERRTRNKQYLTQLMEAYTKFGSFDRATQIAENSFVNERLHGGFVGAKEIWQYAFPRAYQDLVVQDCKKFGGPEELVWAIMRAESRFNPNVISPVGARGLVQLMPYTAEQLAKLIGEPLTNDSDLLDPNMNIKLGARYLSRLLKKFSDFVPLVAASYNAGPHRVYSWLNIFGNLEMDEFVEHIPFIETRNYVKKVVRNFVIYSQLYAQHGKDSEKSNPKWLTSDIPIKVDAHPSPRENWESIE